MKKYALIVAGGSGKRMKSDIPKQFLTIGNQPILMHTINQFYSFDNQIQIILILPQDQFIYWETLCKKYNFTIKVKVISGGKTRFQSVKNGLDSIDEDIGLVAIHDGVRPFVSHTILNDSYETSLQYESALTVVDLKDSIRIATSSQNTALNREDYKLVQTPQTFSISEIKKAYTQAESIRFTDDASVFEANGGEIRLIKGDYRNIKITTSEDILIAQSFLENKTE